MLKKIFNRFNSNYNTAMEQIDFEIKFYMEQREYYAEALADATDETSRAEIQKSLDTATIGQQVLEELRDRIKLIVYES